ncbi:MAG: hypothetical protein RXR82_00575 [Nitrososphaeria archaeon]
MLEPDYARECRRYLEGWYRVDASYRDTIARPFPFPDEECPERLMIATRRSHGIALRALMRDPAALRAQVKSEIEFYNEHWRDWYDTLDNLFNTLADTLALVNVGAYRISVIAIDEMLLSMWNGFMGEWRVDDLRRSKEYSGVRFCGVEYRENEHDKYFNELRVFITDPMHAGWVIAFRVDPRLVNRRACAALLAARDLWRGRILAARAAEAL